MKSKTCPAILIQAASYIYNNQFAKAFKLLDTFEPESIISEICKRVLMHPNEHTDNLFIEHLFGPSKQINLFDIVLRSVPCVTETTNLTFKILKDFYSQPCDSFTHINIGIGKGYFEKQLLTDLSKDENIKNIKKIKIIGLDIDNSSLRESEQNIKEASTLFSKNTIIEFLPICQFAETIPESFWTKIAKEHVDLLGVNCAFTLHHLQKNADRLTVLNNVAHCNPQLFTLIEPDSDHFTPYLPDRLVSCWNLFGTIFDMADVMKLTKDESDAIKYIFFGREIENILINGEWLRYEKHETSRHWLTRLIETGFKPLDISNYQINHPLLDLVNVNDGILTTAYNQIPLVSVIAVTK